MNASYLDCHRIYCYISRVMRSIVILALLFAIFVAGCSTGERTEESDIDYLYELMKMEDYGRVDSTIMAKALAGNNPEVIVRAVTVCGRIKDSRFIKQISVLALNPSKDVRETGIFALGEIGDSSAVPSLIETLHNDDIGSRIRAIEAIGKTKAKSYASFIKPLIKKSDTEAYEAALALWRLGDSTCLEDLRWLAENSKGQPRYGAVYAMFRLFPDSCTNDFRKVFEIQPADGRWRSEIQAIAARGLGKSGNPEAVSEIFSKYYGSLGRAAKIELLRSMGEVKTDRDALEILLKETDDPGLKRVLLFSLGKFEDKRSAKIIEHHLYDPSRQVRLAAIEVFPLVEKSGPTGILMKLIKDENWRVRSEVARSLGKVRSKRSRRELRLMLEDSDDRVKASVIEGLSEYPVSQNLDIFKAALNGSDDTVVRSVTAEALGSSRSGSAFEILEESAKKNIRSDDIDFSRSLVGALGYFVDTTAAGQKSAALIRQFLEHPSRIVRQDANTALGEYSAPNFDPGEFDTDFDRAVFETISEQAGLGILAIIETSKGIVKVKLEPESAPRTAANFVKLTERKFYDGLTFHRVVQNFVIQGGCPRSDGWGGPAYMIREEINPIRFKRGTIGMATSGRDTGGSQFFICLSDQPHLDGRYTAFGNVVEGWDVLDKIEIDDKIISVRIEKGRYDEP